MAENQLTNPGLEGTYSPRGAPQVAIAEGWNEWYDGQLIRPEWQPETRDRGSGRVRTGDKAQKMAMTTAKFDGGIWQHLGGLTVGQWYRFSAWAYMWSSNQDNPDSSIGNGQMHVMAGVNPWGHWPAHYATIWGKEASQGAYNQWVQLEVLFQAWHTECSVMLRCRPEWAVKHNDVYWDDACLEAVDVYIDETPPVEPPEPGEPGEFDYELLAELIAQRVTSAFDLWLEQHQFRLKTDSIIGLEYKETEET